MKMNKNLLVRKAKTSNKRRKMSKWNLGLTDHNMGWIKETDKITFANFIDNFDLKYLGVKSNRLEQKVVDFEICVALDWPDYMMSV